MSDFRLLNSLSGERRIGMRATSFLAWILLIFLLLVLLFEAQVVDVYAKKDKTPPTGSIVINNGEESTGSISVSLSLTAYDPESGVNEVRFSNNGGWDKPWEKFSSTKSWTLLPGNGVKTVYYQIKNNDNLVSVTYTDTIILITQPTPTPTPTHTPTPTPNPTPTPTPEPTPTPTLAPSPPASPTPTPKQTAQPSISPTPPNQDKDPTPVPSPSLTPNPSPTSTPLFGNEELSLEFEQRKTVYYGIAAIALIIGVILCFYTILSK
ncbi:MAG: hypothetical protein NWF10_00710 [Candidatus Bathyarchaeota archaeon]|nr:hypothetical protein [Candidatus Bathyarchaeota archaeon]